MSNVIIRPDMKPSMVLTNDGTHAHSIEVGSSSLLTGIGHVQMDPTSWRPHSRHCLLSFTFVTFLFFGVCLLLLPVSLDIDPVLFVLDLHMKYTVEVVPLRTYIVWFVIVWLAAPYVRSVGHVFAYLYTLADDSERPMDYEAYLLHKDFPYRFMVCHYYLYRFSCCWWLDFPSLDHHI